MKHPSIDFITLGCSKNLVDSETLLTMFRQAGFRCTHDSPHPHAPIVVINTCGFIEDAKQESIDTILAFAQAKEEGHIDKLFVMGCLSQRYLKELEEEIPQVDKYYGKFNYKQLLTDLCPSAEAVCKGPRQITTPNHYAYIKISEGCDHHCAYCAIPLITGRHVSRPADEIISEMQALIAQGTTEFQIIAQELTYYGIDIDGKRHIAELVERMATLPGLRWLRLHYAYPTQFPWELTDVINRHPTICRYLDVALQHISTPVLQRMGRHITEEETYDFINRLREAVPGIRLRTTLMVGFPGETEDDFKQLLDFVSRARFDCMGAFAYSEEEATPAAKQYADDVPDEVKERRLSQLMALQQRISTQLLADEVGHTHTVVIDRQEGDYYIGRTQYASPEVDPEVLIPANEGELEIGHYYDARITSSEEFDLYATIHHIPS